MPKETVYRTGKNCFADVMVRWGKVGNPGDPRVDLFMIATNGPSGAFYFEPTHPEEMGLCEGPIAEGDRKPMIGPVSVDLDRDGINRLIRLLRKARDQAYGADA